jgi:ABC-type Fe3+/spermidine/putrescine transport system ATPase subunit
VTTPAVLVARDLQVRRGTRRTAFELRVEALDLHAGEALVILGPNGAGKSTLLRTLAGLEETLAGRIERSVRGPVTMVFQRPIALDGKVEHNVKAALLGQHLSRTETRERVGEALERFGIGRLRSRRAATLSGGELRRLALARAFALRPAVLLLDEPFDDLDAAAQESLSLDLRCAIEDTDVALGFVTHDLRRALLLADRIAVLLEGRIVQVDRREIVLAHPITPVVARMVGMVNLLPGTITGGKGDGLATVEIDAQHRIPVLESGPPGSRVTVGIRPEHLKLETGRGGGVPIGKGTVRYIVSDGWVSMVTLEFASIQLRTHLIAGRGPARTLAPGDVVGLSIRPEDVHLMSCAAKSGSGTGDA